MSYAGPVNRAKASTRPLAAQPHDGTDWQQMAIFGTGLALGIALGAGAALLTAPRTGAETRAAFLAGAGRVRRTTARRGRDAWDDLGDEIRSTTRALRRRRARRELADESAFES